MSICGLLLAGCLEADCYRLGDCGLFTEDYCWLCNCGFLLDGFLETDCCWQGNGGLLLASWLDAD